MVNCMLFPLMEPLAAQVPSVEVKAMQFPETVPVKLFSEFALAEQSMGQAPLPVQSAMEPDTVDPDCEVTSS